MHNRLFPLRKPTSVSQSASYSVYRQTIKLRPSVVLQLAYKSLKQMSDNSHFQTEIDESLELTGDPDYVIPGPGKGGLVESGKEDVSSSNS